MRYKPSKATLVLLVIYLIIAMMGFTAALMVAEEYGIADIPYWPHDRQWEFHNDEHRFRVLACGSRWGKERSCVPEMINCIARQSQEKDRPGRHLVPNIHWWAVAPTYALTKQLWMELKFFTPKQFIEQINESEKFIKWKKCYGGALIEMKSAHRPEELVSVGLDGVLITECGLIKRMVWKDSIRPRLMSRQGIGIFNGTPRGKWEGRDAQGKKIKSLLYELYLKGQSDDPEWQSWRFPTWTNPYIPPEEIESARRENADDPRLFDQNIGAEFIEFAVGKAVYDKVWQNAIIKPVFDKWAGEDIFVGFDRGYHHPGITWSYINQYEQVCLAAEWMPNQIDRDRFLKQAAKKTKLMFPKATIYAYKPHDFANKNDDGKNWESVAKDLGFRGPVGKRTNDGPIRRVEAIRKKMLLREDGRFGMLVDPGCEILIEGFQGAFHYPEVIDRPEDEKPYKDGFYDHLQDAFGEFCLGHFGKIGEIKKRQRGEVYIPKHDSMGRPG